MRNKPGSIDGFVPRNNRRTLGDAHDASAKKVGQAHEETTIGKDNQTIQTASEVEARAAAVSRQEIDDSLNGIDDEAVQPPRRRSIFRRRSNKPPKSRRRKIIGWVIRILLLLILVAGIYMGYKFIVNGTSILQGNIFDVFKSDPLKEDENGRTNILVFGTSGSVEDQRHDGANLTDTLMVLSVDQDKKNAYMVSLPRDLYIRYDEGCSSGYEFKVNELYQCVLAGGSDEEAAAKALGDEINEVTGLEIQYYAHVNWAVVVKAVNAVGGIDVDVKGNGSCAWLGYPDGSVIDTNMRIKLKPGMRHMNGDKALRFSRARGEKAPTCGLDRGDYDRQANQQKVLKALQKKASSAETLTNVGKVTSLMDALGQNLRTDFATSEVQTLMGLVRDIPSDKINSIDLYAKNNELLTGGTSSIGASIQVPTAGMFDYSEIQSFIHKTLNATEVTKEEAQVALYNGGSVEGYAGKQAERLERAGFTIATIENTPSGSYNGVVIYDLTSKKPATKKKLISLYGASVKPSNPPFNVSDDTDFVVIFGRGTGDN
jgi:LCP family protein required for cell wall assembly